MIVIDDEEEVEDDSFSFLDTEDDVVLGGRKNAVAASSSSSSARRSGAAAGRTGRAAASSSRAGAPIGAIGGEDHDGTTSSDNEQPAHSHTKLFPPDTPPVPCPGCFEDLCLHCRDTAHPTSTCSAWQTKRANERDGARALEQTAARRRWKKCQQCGVFVERSDGCNHMTCACRHEFCYNCGADWKPVRKCSCPFFTEQDLLEDAEDLEEGAEAIGAAAAGGPGGQGRAAERLLPNGSFSSSWRRGAGMCAALGHVWVWRQYRNPYTQSYQRRRCDACGADVGGSCFNCRTCDTKRCRECQQGDESEEDDF